MARLLLGTALFTAAGLARFPALHAGEDRSAAIQKFVRSMEERRKIAQAVRYEVEGAKTITKGRFMNGYPKEDHTSEVVLRWTIHFTNGWVRKETSRHLFSERAKEFVPRFEIELFDGKDTRVFQPREKNTSAAYTPIESQPEILVQTPQQSGLFFEFLDAPVLWAHGLIDTGESAVVPSKLLHPLTAANFHWHGEGAVGEDRCIILRTPPNKIRTVHEYWIDPSKGYSILRYKNYDETVTDFLVEIAYQETQWGYLPKSWSRTRFWPSGHPQEKDEVSVKTFVMDPPTKKEDFQAALEPGRILYKDGKTYRVRSDGKLEDFVYRDLSGGRPLVLWIVIGVAILTAAFVLLRKWKR